MLSLTKKQKRDIARNYIVSLLQNFDGVYTTKYANTTIEEDVANAIREELLRTACRVNKTITTKSTSVELDGIIADIINTKGVL